jgi:TonB family protein
MAYRAGRCTNDLYCSLASGKQNLQIPVDSLFVCPQCGKPLTAPSADKRSFSTPALLAVGGLVAGAGALFAAGSLIGGRSSAASTPVQPVHIAQAKPAPKLEPVAAASAPAPAASAAPPPVQAAQTTTPAAAPVITTAPAPSLAEAKPAAPTPSAPQAPPVSPAPVQTAAAEPAARPPMQLAMLDTPRQSPADAQRREAERKQEAEARAQAEAEQARAAEQARRAEAAQLAADKQKKAQLAAQDLRRKQYLAKAQADAEAKAKQEQDAARAAQQAALDAQAREQAARAQAARAAAAAPPPAKLASAAPVLGPTRGFSPNPIAGGAPVYPSAYEGEGRIGHVTVSCLITGGGSPTGCHVVASQGGIGFNNAALAWLRSGRVRFNPILRNGQPTSEEHSWSMSFEP